MRLVRIVPLVLAGALLGGGCGVFGGDAGPIDGIWIVTEIDGQPIVPGENTVEVPYVDVGDGQARGSFGCNAAGATLEIDSGILAVDGVTKDDGPCSVALSFAENAMLDVLGSPRVEFTREDDRMVWVAAGRQIILTEASEPPP